MRVHYDGSAANSTKAINARAYTIGRDMIFGNGQYAPETAQGKKLLAHELTHVMQQTSNPKRFQRKEPDDAESLKSAGSTCPVFISLTAKGVNPELHVVKSRCRFSLGECSTPRGTCGSTKASGMVFQAKVNAPSGCAGKLGYMQNVLSVTRKSVLDDGTSVCTNVTTAHHDGGPPWKGCKVVVSSAGDHTITSDDCPNVTLDGFKKNVQYNHPKSISIKDSFKMYLLWKVSGSSKWKPIANVSWGWEGAIKWKKGAKKSDECTSRYTVTTASHTDGTGKASKEMPVSSPSIGSVKPGDCEKE